MSGKKEELGNQSYTPHFFESVTSYQELDPDIVQGIIRCVHASGMRTTDEDVLNHIGGDAVIVYQDDKTKDIVAFSSTSFISPNQHMGSQDISDETGCYLVGATISQEYQGKGLYSEMNQKRIMLGIDRGLSLVFTQTQNGRVLKGVQSALDSLRDAGVIRNYTEERVLRPGHYGRPLTEQKPEPAFDELDYEAGDAYLFLFHLQGVRQK